MGEIRFRFVGVYLNDRVFTLSLFSLSSSQPKLDPFIKYEYF
jgi:hypothetical protein